MTNIQLYKCLIEPATELTDFRCQFKINGKKVSVIKWNKKLYDGVFEIFSFDKLFKDIRKFSSLDHLLEFITELEEKYGPATNGWD